MFVKTGPKIVKSLTILDTGKIIKVVTQMWLDNYKEHAFENTNAIF